MSLASLDESGALVLGHLELRGKWLVLEVNSAARAERGKQMLMKLLGGLVATPVTETQSVQSALAEHRARKRSSAEEAAPKDRPCHSIPTALPPGGHRSHDPVGDRVMILSGGAMSIGWHLISQGNRFYE
jgi:hypothetical protein